MEDAMVLVIFGASGDLSHRKLLPALESLSRAGSLPSRLAILGVGRTAHTDESFRSEVASKLPADSSFLSRLYWESLDTTSGGTETYARLSSRLESLCNEHNLPRNYIFYLAVPPELGEKIPLGLALAGLSRETDGFRRIVFEKPFGHDLQSAKALNLGLLEHWTEGQIFRIDHYLGKETVQNLLVFHFSNEIFDSLWDRRFIEFVEISVAEELGVEGRAGYFDRSGILRDMVQNHLLQLLAMVAMDAPSCFDAACVRGETLKIFRSLKPFGEEELRRDLVLAQYESSVVGGRSVKGYREEGGIAPDSRTETFAALKVMLDHPRWEGVPFYLRTGKRLPSRVSEIVIHFRKNPYPAFGIRSGTGEEQNRLIIRIQPDEGILLSVGLKAPGAGFTVKKVDLDFHYSSLSGTALPDSYERLLLDVMAGDATLYALGEAVESCWAFIDPLVAYRESGAALESYEAGSWGPEAADLLLSRDGRAWRYPCRSLTADGGACEL